MRCRHFVFDAELAATEEPGRCRAAGGEDLLNPPAGWRATPKAENQPVPDEEKGVLVHRAQAHAFGGQPLPEIAKLDPALIQCFYGAEEEKTACTAPEFDRAERIETGGGHHFDGDYRALAQKIIAGAKRRDAPG